MKKSFFPFLLVLFIAVFYMGCKNEDILVEPTIPTVEAEEPEVTDDSRMPIIAIVRPFPIYDLVITNYTTNVVPTTTLCGPTLPNVSCAGGQRSFMATVTITNQGLGNIPASANLQVLWSDSSSPVPQLQTPPHNGIPGGGSITVSRPYYMGPCDCGGGGFYFTHQFSAQVNPNATIIETNYNNNNSAVYNACDGC